MIRSIRKWYFYGCLDLPKQNLKISQQAKSQFVLYSSSINETRYDTGIKIYDSAVMKKVQLLTKWPKTVLWYCCGPTVYDSAHLGHACSYMHFDIIRRIMESFFGLNVVMVMNITDIDDKIIAKSFELNQPYDAISYLYEKEFFEDMELLNISPPTVKARVTENIPEVIEFIKQLVNSGFAYASLDGSVYFNVSKFVGYGKFAPAQETNSDPQAKQSNKDFALWKSAKPKEPFWDSPWGRGRPGWHIECSAIASKYLGQSIDIHSGGVDLKFPHHENEEAQCCARYGISHWVNHWIHTGHLYSKENEKMSKSLKNGVSIRDFLKDYTANVLRIFCLMIPYKNDVEFRRETLEIAASVDKKISQFLCDLQAVIQEQKHVSFDEQEFFKVLHDTERKINLCFGNDFDTNKALNELLNLISFTQSVLRLPSQNNTTNSSYCFAAVFNFIHSMLKKLGYNYSSKAELASRGIDDVISSTVQFRSEIRERALGIKNNQPKELQEQKKYLLQACDSVRDSFLKYGIELKDHSKKTTWNYIDKNMKMPET